MCQAASPPRFSRGDVGGGVIEYSVLLFLIAAMFSAIAVAAVPGRTADLIEYGVCLIEQQVSGDDTDCSLEGGGTDDSGEADERDPEDYIPTLCERDSFREASSFNVKIGATFSSETRIQRISLADGSTWFIAEPANKSGGVEVGYGASLGVKDTAALSRTVGAEASYDWGQGQIWTFDPDQSDQADEFEQQLRDETSIGSNPVSALWNDWFGGDPDLPDPQMELDIKGGSGSVTASYDTGLSLDQETNKSQSDSEIDLGQGVHGDLGGSYQNIVRTNNSDPDNVITSETNQISGSIGAGGSIMLGAGGSGNAGWTSGVREDRNENGELTGLFLTASFDRSLAFNYGLPFGFTNNRVANAGPDANASTDIDRTVDNTYVYVEIDNEEERQAGEAFLDEYGGFLGAGDYFIESVLGEHGYFEEEPGDDAEPWADLFYEKSQVWQSSHDREFEDWEIGASARVKIFAVGGGYGEEKYEQTTDDAWYLGPPGEDGTREQIRFDDCIADE